MDKLYECNFSSWDEPDQPVSPRSTDNVNKSDAKSNIDAYPFALNKHQLYKLTLAVCGAILENKNGLVDDEELKELARGEKPARYALELSYTENGRALLEDPCILKPIGYATMILGRFDEFKDFWIGVCKVSLSELRYAKEAYRRVESAVSRRHPPLSKFLRQHHDWSFVIPPRTALLFMNRCGIDKYTIVCYRTKIHFLERLAFETTKHMLARPAIPDTWEILERAYEAAIEKSPLIQRWIELAETACEITR